MAEKSAETTVVQDEVPRGGHNLDRLSADDSGARPPLWQSFGKFILWLVLLLWLAVLGNYRVGNPMALPGCKLLEGGWRGAPGPAAGEASTAPADAPAADASPEVKVSEGSAPAARREPPADVAEEVSRKTVRKEAPVSTWAGPMLDRIKEGDWNAAAAIARDADSPIGDDIAVFLRDVPDPDALVVEAIMASRGSEVEITYNGKSRLMVPQSSLETVVKATFNGRAIEVDAAKLDDAEKLRLIVQVVGGDPLRHAAAAAVALRAGDREAIRAHIAASGPLAKILGR